MRASRIQSSVEGGGLVLASQSESTSIVPQSRNSSAERLAVELPFLDSAGNRIKLAGIYRQQQTSYDIHTIRYYLQEDGYGQKALNILCDYVVGANGITVDFGEDKLNNILKSHQFSAMHKERAFGEITRFMVKSLARDGEYINQIVADMDDFYTPSIDIMDLPLNTRKRLGQSTTLAIGYTSPYYSGIDRDDMKRPLRYNFYPEDGRPYVLHADNVIHNFAEVYAGQERGLSWFIGCVDTMAELSGFERNVSQAVRNAASDPGHYSVSPRWFQPIRPEDAADSTKALDLLTRTVTRSPDKRGILPEGVEWKPSEVGNVFTGQVTDSHRKSQLARISASVGLSYFTVSGDLSSANFSSLQQGNLDNRALFRATQNLILESVKQVIKRWVLWQSLRSSSMQRKFAHILANFSEEIRYILPPFEYIDRVKSSMADKGDLENQTTSRSAVILAHGQDPDAVFRQIAEDEKRLRDYYDEYGVPYPDKSGGLTKESGDDKIESSKDDDTDKDDDKDDKESEKNK